MTGPDRWHDDGPRAAGGLWDVEVRPAVFQEPTPTSVPVPPPSAGPGEEPDPDGDGFVRPFIVTGGRTRPVDGRLRVESVITALPAALSAPLGFERRRIVVACQRPIAVAEVAHTLRVPVGVARVLIADLIAEGLVTVHEHAGSGTAAPSLALLERIRDGVRAL